VDLTVARPAPRRASDPIIAIADRVEHLRRFAWMLAQTGTAPNPVLVNTAVIGTMLATATARAHHAAALAGGSHAGAPGARSAGPMHGTGAADPGTAAERAAAADLLAARWSQVARQAADLCSAHPSPSAIQVERVDLARLLSRITPDSCTDPRVADALWAALQRYSEVARHLARAVRRAQDRGEVYLRGRAIPTPWLQRDPDLIGARLADRPVPLPPQVLRRLLSTYAEVSAGTSARVRPKTRHTGDGRSPAA